MKSMPQVTTPITKHPMFRRWTAIRQEILNSNNPVHSRRRKLKCTGLDNFKTFVFFVDREIGPPPRKASKLNRINNKQGWIPGNIRWTDQTGVGQTQHNIYQLKWKNKTYSLRALSEFSKVGYASFRLRLRRGWTIKDAIEIPPLTKNGRN